MFIDDENIAHLPYEIHDINVSKISEDEFRIIFGTKGQVEGLYKGFAEADIDRNILERFVKKAAEALAE